MTDKANLIFVVSQPRSGSTLLQGILSNNEQVNTVSEPWLLFHFLSYFNPSLVEAKYSNQLAFEATNDFFSKTDFQEGIKRETENFVSSIYQKTLGQKQNLKYILDKTPRYYEILNSICDVFPNARIIILKRNPLAVLSSIIDTWSISGINDLYPYRRDILEAPFLLQNFVEERRNTSNVLVTSYELIADSSKKEIERIYQWLGINFKEEYLDYSGNQKYKGEYGDSTGIHRASEPTKVSEKWTQKLQDAYWKKFFIGYANYLTEDFLRRYGYSKNTVKGKKTEIFETFNFISKQEIPSRPPIKEYFQYLRYRSTYKLYTR